MRSKFLLLGFCMLLSTFVKAQDTLTYFCNEGEQKTVKDSASFLRKAFFANGFWNVYDYYLTGELKTIGTYNGKNEKQGHFINYHLNKRKLSEGNYKDNEKDGKWTSWHENGTLESTANYLYGYYVGAYKSWYDNDVIREESFYVEDINIIQSSLRKNAMGGIIPINGVLTGICKYYFPNGQISSKEEWKDKSLISLEIWNEVGTSEAPTMSLEGFLTNSISPKYKEGEKGLKKFFNRNLRYPSISEFRNQSGMPVVGFYIEKDGTMSDIEIISPSLYASLNEEALRVVKLLNGKWIPGKIHNQITKSYYTIPISFNIKY